MHALDALDLVRVQVRQGDIVAEQKGKALVVVLEIERLAQALRQLVDEAEHAFVPAGALPVHKVALKFQAQLRVPGLYKLQPVLLAASLHQKLQLPLGLEEAVV